ncbi:Mitochondrial carrier protein [Penicillium sp. IBT 35674x]|nr:Mitochondrial carrier protein [Penicillium sp. IBT 35674x]
MSLTSRVFGLFSTTATSDPATSDFPTSIPQTQPLTHNEIGIGAKRHAGDRHILEEEEEPRPPYLHAMLAGGTGDPTTRRPKLPPKYTSMTSSYATIYRQEGLLRGLYGGVIPAFWGSFPGTVTFFGVYEFTKRAMLDRGINPNIAYLSGGFFADLAASIVYVPSEVLKTRLQLQGRYNNPYFHSGYNYRSTTDAFRTIVRQEGVSALFHGYKATIFRDLPFSALQFAFYEQEQKLAKEWVGQRDIGLGLEILTAATAGGMAGVITCPLDVVKTRIQTQQNPPQNPSGSSGAKHTGDHAPKESPRPHAPGSPHSSSKAHSRPISTSSPSTSVAPPGAPRLDTSSVFTGLKMIYRREGLAGWFRGVGPRGVWTSIQSGTMLVMYQYLLKQIEAYQGLEGSSL